MKIKKSDLFQLVQEQAEMIAELSGMVELNKMSIIKLENEREKPQLKQLDQSAFDHPYVDDRLNYVALNTNGQSIFFSNKPKCNLELGIWYSIAGSTMPMLKGYDASNWQNSLIERDTAKELTGSELCRAMLARGDKFILCGVSDSDDSDAANHEDDDFLAEAVTDFDDKDGLFGTTSMRWNHAVPINNQGAPLTASEAGL